MSISVCWIALFSVVCGCSSSRILYCDAKLVDDAITVGAPPGEVTAVTGRGACEGSRVRCLPRNYGDPMPFVAGCEDYQVEPTSIGRCTLTIALAHAPPKVAEVVVETHESCDGREYLGAVPSTGHIYVSSPPDAGSETHD